MGRDRGSKVRVAKLLTEEGVEQLAAFTLNIFCLEMIIRVPVGFKTGFVCLAHGARSETSKMNALDVTQTTSQNIFQLN